jgi:hypothetical protein
MTAVAAAETMSTAAVDSFLDRSTWANCGGERQRPGNAPVTR